MYAPWGSAHSGANRRQHRRNTALTRRPRMTTEGNTATYRRWFEDGWGRGSIDLVDELYAHDYVTHALGSDFPPTGEGLKMFTGAFREGFPDLSCAVEEVIAEGDRVAGRLTLRGTHRGTLLGIPATGKPVVVSAMVIARFDQAGKWV